LFSKVSPIAQPKKEHHVNKLIVGAAVIGLAAAPPIPGMPDYFAATPVHAQSTGITIEVFFDRLSSSGRWVRHPDYEYVWVPVDVDPDWSPYTHGRWIYVEDYGWYFHSDEPFAWAVYHYGRWAYDPAIGWFWVPGVIWAPAWVSWRRGPDYIGWAPLAPYGRGYAITVRISEPDPPPGFWVFVPIDRFAEPQLEIVIVERERVPVLYRETEFIGPVIIQNNVVINTAIDIDIIREHNEVTVENITIVDDPASASQSQGPVAFRGKVKVDRDAKPAEAVEPDSVEAPTAGQDLEASDETGEDAGAPADETDEARGESADERPDEKTAREETPRPRRDAQDAGELQTEEEAPAQEEEDTAAEESKPSPGQRKKRLENEEAREGSPVQEEQTQEESEEPAQRQAREAPPEERRRPQRQEQGQGQAREEPQPEQGQARQEAPPPPQQEQRQAPEGQPLQQQGPRRLPQEEAGPQQQQQGQQAQEAPRGQGRRQGQSCPEGQEGCG
jgi:hypothetical protein